MRRKKGESMNNTNFDFVNYDFESAVLERKTVDIHAYLDRLLESLTKLFQKKQVFDLQKKVDLHKKKVHFCARKEIKSENISFAIGRYYGMLEALSGCVDDLVKKERVLNEINASSFEKIPHLNDIIAIIATNPGIRHGELATRVGIEKNTLTSITDRLVECDVITFSRPGKFKYYYLTTLGKSYYEDNLIHIKESLNLDYLIEQLVLVMSKNSSPMEIAEKVLHSLNVGQHKFKEYKASNSNQIDPLHLIPWLIAEKPAFVATSNSSEVMYADTATIFGINSEIASESLIYFSNSQESLENTYSYENEVMASDQD